MTQALHIQDKLTKDQPLTYEDRTFLIGFIIFATTFIDYVKTAGQEKWIKENQ